MGKTSIEAIFELYILTIFGFISLIISDVFGAGVSGVLVRIISLESKCVMIQRVNGYDLIVLFLESLLCHCNHNESFIIIDVKTEISMTSAS